MTRAALSPCPNCSRHLRVDSPRCPFCATSLDGVSLPVTPDVQGGRLTRAALFAFAATVAGCTTTRTTPGVETAQTPVAPTTPRDNGAAMGMYGGPPPPTPYFPPDFDAGPPEVADAGAPSTAADAGAPPAANTGDIQLPDLNPPRRRTGGSTGVRYGAPPPPDAFV